MTEQWIDWIRPLAASALGSGLAFGGWVLQQRLLRRDQQRAAGSAAVIVIGEVLSALLQARQYYHTHRAQVLAEQPNVPLWYQVRPLMIPFDGSLSFDLPSLVFVADEGKPGLLSNLSVIQQRHRQLVGMIAELSETLEDLQAKLEPASLTLGAAASRETFERAIGPKIVAKANSLVEGLFHALDEDHRLILKTHDELVAVLKKRFRKKPVLTAGPVEKFRATLPP